MHLQSLSEGIKTNPEAAFHSTTYGCYSLIPKNSKSRSDHPGVITTSSLVHNHPRYQLPNSDPTRRTWLLPMVLGCQITQVAPVERPEPGLVDGRVQPRQR